MDNSLITLSSESFNTESLSEVCTLIGTYVPGFTLAPKSVIFPFKITRQTILDGGIDVLGRCYAALDYTRLTDILSLIILSDDNFDKVFVFTEEIEVPDNYEKIRFYNHLLGFAFVIAIKGSPKNSDTFSFRSLITNQNPTWSNPHMMLKDLGQTGSVFPYMSFMRRIDFRLMAGPMSTRLKEGMIGLRYIRMAYHARAHLRLNSGAAAGTSDRLDAFCARFNMSSCFVIVHKDEYSEAINKPNFNRALIKIIRAAFLYDQGFSDFFRGYMKQISNSDTTKQAVSKKITAAESHALLSVDEIKAMDNSWHFSVGLLDEHQSFYIALDGTLNSASSGSRVQETRLYTAGPSLNSQHMEA